MDPYGSISLDSLIKDYSDPLYRYLVKLTGSEDDAEDILQETLIKISASLPDLYDPIKLRTWSFRIATNTAMDYYRKNSKYCHVEFDENLHNIETNNRDVVDTIMIEEMNKCIRKKMNLIAPHYNSVIILYYFERMSMSEIANICDISVSAAKVRLHRGKNLLKRLLTEGCNFYYDDNNDMRCYSKTKIDG